MNLKLVHCPTLQAAVTVVTDFEGVVTRVICPWHIEATGSCDRKMAETSGGPLSRLVQRVSDNTLGTRGNRCDIRA